ncbi:MAG: thymidine phosphorylase [Kiritimatiellae bacterium]|nr:thymidine phosphorylase [Kiritimatiellia bacterium]
MVPQWLIERKRDGGELSPEEIAFLVEGFTTGAIPDYQMAAWAMAVFFRGMTPAEIAALTGAMMRSGDVLNFDDLPRPTADKHSTGGIGDKISLILAPLAASAGLAVPMISGRGLGLTGGTLDKLESIPGLNVRLSQDRFRSIVGDVGCCIAGQTERFVPADRKLYAPRDVTGTVPSIPLIAASIMSKKLAEGARSLVLDVKCGRGAFMRTRDEAQALAESLMCVGRDQGRHMAALITDMERPLGATIGNAVEVAEAIEVLRGGGPRGVRDLTVELTAHMVVLSGGAAALASARRELEACLDDGRAAALFQRMIEAQGGDPRIVDDPSLLPLAPVQRDVPAPRDGYVADIDAEQLGRVALLLGAGRRRTDDTVDHAVGISHLAAPGTRLCRGDTLMRLHARTADAAAEVFDQSVRAVTLSDAPPPHRPLVLKTIGETP